jgi:hypothetical protein
VCPPSRCKPESRHCPLQHTGGSLNRRWCEGRSTPSIYLLVCLDWKSDSFSYRTHLPFDSKVATLPGRSQRNRNLGGDVYGQSARASQPLISPYSTRIHRLLSIDISVKKLDFKDDGEMLFNMTEAPVLLTIFNRPTHTAKVFDAIRKARPRQLFVNADGPRDNHPNDHSLCEITRGVIKPDWKCDLRWRVASTNRGCRLGMYEALNWFFDHVDEGIILEDDCVPEPSFFQFCRELLKHYRDDHKIFGISGNNFTENRPDRFSYYFLKTTHIWGWASWRRSWKLVDLFVSDWPKLKLSGKLEKFLERSHTRAFWNYIIEDLYGQQGDTWSGSIIYTILNHDLLGISPVHNLVRNIGFGDAGVHKTPSDHKLANVPTRPVTFPLVHPPEVKLSLNFDKYVEEVWDVSAAGKAE